MEWRQDPLRLRRDYLCRVPVGFDPREAPWNFDEVRDWDGYMEVGIGRTTDVEEP